MIIQLDAKTRIVSTENCWQLQRPRNYKGAKKWEPYKWFTTFRYALEEAVHREIRVHPAVGVADAIEAVSDIVRKYENLIPSEYRLTNDSNHGHPR